MKCIPFVLAFVAAVLAVAVPNHARAQGVTDPCELLTDDELESVLDVKVSRHIGTGDLGSADRVSCTWVTAVSSQRGTLAIGRGPDGASVQTQQFVRGLTQVGWTVQVQEDTPSLWCGQLSPPPTDKGQTLPGPGARCEAVMRGFSFALDVFSPTATAQKVKALVDILGQRLP